jgi:hypothetical protein
MPAAELNQALSTVQMIWTVVLSPPDVWTVVLPLCIALLRDMAL